MDDEELTRSGCSTLKRVNRSGSTEGRAVKNGSSYSAYPKFYYTHRVAVIYEAGIKPCPDQLIPAMVRVKEKEREDER